MTAWKWCMKFARSQVSFWICSAEVPFDHISDIGAELHDLSWGAGKIDALWLMDLQDTHEKTGLGYCAT